VMNLGPQPTIDPAAPSAVEVHLLDRQIDLLGRELLVEPVAYLREQQRFDSVAALSRQIAADAQCARELGAGVGIAQSPDDEGRDAAKQQNS